MAKYIIKRHKPMLGLRHKPVESISTLISMDFQLIGNIIKHRNKNYDFCGGFLPHIQRIK